MKIKIFCLSALLVFAASCASIEDRQTLTNSYTPETIVLEASQSTPGGNEITLKMLSPGVQGWWDYKVNTTFQNDITFICPFTGDVTFTYHVGTPYINGNLNNTELVTKDIVVKVDQIDHPVDEHFKMLCGENNTKTWKFAGTAGDGNKWWYMCNGTNADECWWNSGGECCPPADADATITFDLIGAANATYTNGSDVVKGTFAFNSDYTAITVSGCEIPGSGNNYGDGTGVFNVFSISADRLTLTVANAPAMGTGWAWVFVPVE